MRKLLATILLLAFAAAYLPTISGLLHADAICLAEGGDDGLPDKPQDTGKEKDKKDTKEYLQCLPAIPLQATDKFSYRHDSHCLGSNPAADVLTPPPNRA